jgi:hypothetical protein
MNRGRLLVSITIATLAGLLLWRLGSWPPVRSWSASAAWIDRHGAVAAAAALARLAAIAGAIYVDVLCALALVTSGPRRAGQRRVHRLAPAAFRHLLGIGVAGMLVLPAPAGARTTARDTPVIVLVEPAPPTAPPTTTPADVPIVVRVDEPATTSVAGAATWKVQAGDHFWSIAESVVGPDASTDTVARYWRRLVAANRDRLVVPGDADLVFPGQELVLPPTG